MNANITGVQFLIYQSIDPRIRGMNPHRVYIYMHVCMLIDLKLLLEI